MLKLGRWWLALIVLVAGGIIIWDMAQPRINPKEIDQQLENALQKQDIIQAVQILENVLQKEPQYHRGRFQVINLYLSQLSKLSEQQRHYCLNKAEQHINIFWQDENLRTDPYILRQYIRILETKRKFGEAYKLYQEVLQKDPTITEIRLSLLPIALAQRDHAKIQEQFTILQKDNGESFQKFPDFYDIYAEWKIMQSNFSDAAHAWEQFLEFTPTSFQIHRNWIEMQQLLGQRIHAQEKYKNLADTTKEEQQRFFYQQLYALTLPIEDSLSYLTNLQKEYEKNQKNVENNNAIEAMNFPIIPQILMQLISLWMRNGECELAIESCKTLEKYLSEDANRRLSWLAHSLFLKRDWENAEKINQELYKNPQSKVNALNGFINLALAQKKYYFAHKHIEEILQPYKKQTLWNIDLQKENYHYQILQSRILFESKDYENALKNLESLDKTPEGWPYYWNAKMLAAQIYFSQENFSQASIILDDIIQKCVRVPELRLRAMILQGIIAFFNKQNPQEIWQKAQQIPWQNYLTDIRESEYLDLFLNQKTPEQCLGISKLPNAENDHYFYLGLYYEMQNKLEDAKTAYRKGLDLSFGQEFPYFFIETRLGYLKNK